MRGPSAVAAVLTCAAVMAAPTAASAAPGFHDRIDETFCDAALRLLGIPTA